MPDKETTISAADAVAAMNILSKCERLAKPLKKKKVIDLKALGSPANQQLVDLLKCQAGRTSQAFKEYHKCHSSVMGMGSYGDKKNCREELQALLDYALEKG